MFLAIRNARKTYVVDEVYVENHHHLRTFFLLFVKNAAKLHQMFVKVSNMTICTTERSPKIRKSTCKICGTYGGTCIRQQREILA